ncbi:isocitrate/isopropylmalate family dehydrogenase [Candidatus Bathyarchaeota archaeon]|jgi:isocitrate/isopropylmalate dehydrogenase|nr:isocitrate/isopropylmalate family dehydrogenase [Candidatus Bathyarchaeota archaeon]
MKERKIAVIQGDGIGPEQTEATLKVLEARAKSIREKILRRKEERWERNIISQ